mgnify:CR=1 FL=1
MIILCVLEQDFLSKVEQGFQVTPFWHQGLLYDDGGYSMICDFWNRSASFINALIVSTVEYYLFM